jgi:hypothetical protein
MKRITFRQGSSGSSRHHFCRFKACGDDGPVAKERCCIKEQVEQKENKEQREDIRVRLFWSDIHDNVFFCSLDGNLLQIT